MIVLRFDTRMKPHLHQLPLADLDSLCREDLIAYLREALALATAQSEQLARLDEQLARLDEQITAMEGQGA